MKVLVVEDDEILKTEIKEFLIKKNLEVTSIVDGEEAITQIDNNNFDLYIIDIYIPKINGLEILKFIRKVDIFTPVIMITASLEISNLELAYEYGCNEYIKKPFHFKELEIRMDNILKKDLDSIIFDDTFLYIKEKNQFLLNGEVLEFRKKEKRFLELLLNNLNKTIGHDTIIDYVWEHEIKESYSLRQLVNGIRKKIPKNIIKTDVGVGYSIENN